MKIKDEAVPPAAKLAAVAAYTKVHGSCRPVAMTAALEAALPHLSQGAVNLPLEGLFRPLEGVEQNQPGFHHAKGWNDAIMHCMDLQRAALTAALPHMGGVSVKPLEWSDPWPDDKEGDTYTSAHLGLAYHIQRNDRWLVTVSYWGCGEPRKLGFFGGLEEAKAAAQADYERRIMSAIKVSASPRVVTDDETKAVLFSVLHHFGPEGTKKVLDSLPEARAALSSAVEKEDAVIVPVEYQIVGEDGEWYAGATSFKEALHYFSVYSQDGPVRMEKVTREAIDLSKDNPPSSGHEPHTIEDYIASPRPTSADKLEVVAWASPMEHGGFMLIADKASATFHEGQGLEIIPLVRQSDATRIITEQAEKIAELERNYALSLDRRRQLQGRISRLQHLAEAAEADRDRMKEALVGIKRASNSRRAEKDGERHEYYYHTAAAALNGGAEK